jgi:BirA family biotin operon repressor/biotin-[acetyl-CoA-carboxylase] ligase
MKQFANNSKHPILLEANIIKKYIQQKPCDIIIFDSISSTNDYLKNHLKVKKNPQICLAEQQTAGKGRFDRNWYSPYGQNIYLSCLWHFDKDVSELLCLSLLVSLAIIKTLVDYGISENLNIKWPNDILYNHQKLAGTLIEIIAESHVNSPVIIGVGLNVNMLSAKASEITRTWTSIAKILGSYQDRNILTGMFLINLFNYLSEFNDKSFTEFLSEWQKYDYLKDQQIKLVNNQKTIIGTALGIDERGCLLLKQDDGRIVAYSSGDTTLV